MRSRDFDRIVRPRAILAVFGLFSFVSLLSPFGCKSAPEPKPAPVADHRPLETKLAEAIDRRIEHGLGWGYVAAYRDGGKTEILVRGKRSLEPPVLLRDTDVFEIGSISKVFTGVLVRLAIAEGRLRPDMTLAEKIPALRGLPAGALTVEALALRRSGLPERALSISGSPREIREADLVAAFSGWTPPAKIDPIADSDAEYPLLGLLLEKAYGRKFGDLLRVKLVTPLGLGNTGIDRTTRRRGKRVPEAGFGYDAAGDSMPATESPGLIGASEGIEMNAREMRTFLDRLANPPSSTIGRAIRASLETGYGWLSDPGARVNNQNGRTAGFASSLLFDRESKRGLFLVGNARISVGGAAGFAFYPDHTDGLLAEVREGRVRASDAEVARLKGRYVFRRLLDADEDAVDPTKLPAGEISVEPKTLEVLEQFGRIVARMNVGSIRTGVLLDAATDEDEWVVIDGFRNAGSRVVVEGEGEDLRLRAQDRGASGKTYWLEYEKRAERPEIFPAQEKE